MTWLEIALAYLVIGLLLDWVGKHITKHPIKETWLFELSTIVLWPVVILVGFFVAGKK